MNLPLFITRRLAFSKSPSFSRFIIRVAVVAVALSMTVMILATSLISGFQREISNKVYGFWAHVHVMPYNMSQDMINDALPLSTKDLIDTTKHPSIAHIQSTALKGGIIKTRDAFEGILLKGAGPDFSWKAFDPYLIRGKSFRPSKEGTRDSILISETTANRLALDTGDRVTLQFIGKRVRLRRVIVGGIYNSGIEEFDKQYALVDLGLIQDLNNWGRDSVGGFEIFLDAEKAAPNRLKRYAVALAGPLLSPQTKAKWKAGHINTLASDLYYEMPSDIRVESIRTLRPSIFDWLDLQTTNELLILFLMILVAGFNMCTALLILILERTRMVGILKAMGSPNKQIRSIFVWNGTWIVGIGLLIGNVVGLLLCFIQSHFGVITLPEDSYYVSVAPVFVDPIWILLLNAITLLIAAVVLFLPAAYVNRIEPVRAIRFQ